MKPIQYILNFVRNSLHFIKVAASSKTVNWNYIGSKKVNCNIDKQSKIYAPYNLNTVSIGKGTYLASNARASYTNIGRFCSIGPNLSCGWGIHPLDGISTSPSFYSTNKQSGISISTSNKILERKAIIIGNDVFIGINVTILDGITIGTGAVIGAGSVVSKDIPPYAIAVGCPIRIIKYRFDEQTIDSLLKSNWWDGNEEMLMDVERNVFNVNEFLSKSKVE